MFLMPKLKCLEKWKRKEDRGEPKPQLSDCSKQKKQGGVISKPKPFSKFSLSEKDGVIPECFTNKVNVVAAIDGSRRLLLIDDLRDENIDIQRVKKYFNRTGWYAALEKFHKKEKNGWTCLVCHKCISKEESSFICERSLRWCHISWTNLKSHQNLGIGSLTFIR